MAWLGESIGSAWAKRIAITIDADKIDADLTDFTVPLRLSAAAGSGADDVTAVFDDLGANSLKIAVTLADGETQCYVEVAYWDNANELAVLWAKVPSIDDTADTVLYLYFDPLKANNTAYVDLTNTGIAWKAWDEHHIGVWHLNQSPGGADSVKNSSNNWSVAGHGTPQNSPALVTGKLAKGYDLERGSNQYITFSKAASFKDRSSYARTPAYLAGNNYFTPRPFSKSRGSLYVPAVTGPYFSDEAAWQLGGGTGDFTLELWWMSVSIAIQSPVFSAALVGQYDDANNYWLLGFRKQTNSDYRLFYLDQNSGSAVIDLNVQIGTSYSDSVFNHIALVRSGNTFKIFWNGVEKGSVSNSSSTSNRNGGFVINYSGAASSVGGYFSEIRLSNVARYTNNFTPQSDVFSDDANTQLYVPCDPIGINTAGFPLLTIEALVKYEDRPASGQSLFIFYDSTYNQAYARAGLYLTYQAANDTRIMGGVRATSMGTFYSVTDPSDLSPGGWTHIALTANSVTDRIRAYRNGSQVAESTSAFNALENNNPVADTPAIGRYTYSLNPQNFDGVLEEVRLSIIDRSASWEKALYNACFDTLIKDYATIELAPSNFIFDAILLGLATGEDWSFGLVQAASAHIGFCPISATKPTLEVEATTKPKAVWSGARPRLSIVDAKKPIGVWSATKPELV
jgi:hypothetical protein